MPAYPLNYPRDKGDNQTLFLTILVDTLWWLSLAMDNPTCIDDFPIKPPFIVDCPIFFQLANHV